MYFKSSLRPTQL